MARLANFQEIGRKTLAVGRNYSEHAKELGNAVPEVPLVFMKPTSSFISEGVSIKIPKGCKSLHHEIELGVVIGRKGSNIAATTAMDHVGGYILALDMTARDFQEEAKKKGDPWTIAKGFDTSCPVSRFVSKDQIADPHNLGLSCSVNGIVKQKGNTSDMVFTIPTLISYISTYFTLEEGDVILTGTPEGVGPVKPGDVIEGALDDIVSFRFSVAGEN